MSTPRSTSSSASATVIERCGHERVAAVSDRAEHEHRVHERRDEGAERHLRAAVAHEVAQDARPELGRRERERDDRDREHEADDRDDGRGGRGEDLAGRVGGTAVDPRRQRQIVAGTRRGRARRSRRTARPRATTSIVGTTQSVVRRRSRRHSDRWGMTRITGGPRDVDRLVPTRLPGSPRRQSTCSVSRTVRSSRA